MKEISLVLKIDQRSVVVRCSGPLLWSTEAAKDLGVLHGIDGLKDVVDILAHQITLEKEGFRKALYELLVDEGRSEGEAEGGGP